MEGAGRCWYNCDSIKCWISESSICFSIKLLECFTCSAFKQLFKWDSLRSLVIESHAGITSQKDKKHYTKTTKLISMKLEGRMGYGPGKDSLNVGLDLHKRIQVSLLFTSWVGIWHIYSFLREKCMHCCIPITTFNMVYCQGTVGPW